MSKSDRNNPKRSTASESRYSIFEFEREFPDDRACLDWLVAHRYPDGIYCPTCEKVTKHHRENKRPSYACQFCGHREHPMVGTIFENSATSLRLWFYAIYLMASTRCGISAKQLERELGVTYKTAWRMFHQIRTLFDQDADPLGGEVEMDETYVGGRPRKGEISPNTRANRRKWVDENKTQVFGMVERGGRVRAKVVPSRQARTIQPIVATHVLPESTIFTDEGFNEYTVGRRYRGRHHRIRHRAGIYVDGNVHTQTIEGFWSLLKNGLRGVYHSVSEKHLQSYVDEYAFRYNHRKAGGRGVFTAMLDRIPEASSEQPS
ncbi:MAG TPA: IS1595 family transposase [Actinomycetota bacterium]|jgi:transposase-like protein|nr:IS1595 family transposase [Actinomycetota bacterium]